MTVRIIIKSRCRRSYISKTVKRWINFCCNICYDIRHIRLIIQGDGHALPAVTEWKVVIINHHGKGRRRAIATIIFILRRCKREGESLK